MATLTTTSMAAATPAAAPSLVDRNRAQSQDSDYGSDFSEGEEDIVNQLLQDLNDTEPAIATRTSAPATASISTPLLESFLASIEESTSDTTSVPGLDVPAAPLSQEPQHHALATPTPTASAPLPAQGVLSGAAKRPAPKQGGRLRDADARVPWPDVSNHSVSYPDREFPPSPPWP